MLSAGGPTMPCGEGTSPHPADHGAATASSVLRCRPGTVARRRPSTRASDGSERAACQHAAMRSAALRPLLVLAVSGLAALGAAAPAGAHGGTKIAEGGTGGVTILTQAEETTTAAGKDAVDLSTILQGPGTGDAATVVYYVRPKGGETFRATTTRDAAGIAHTDITTAGRGEWREWDVSAVVDLSTGKRLRVSNAEANPPGPDPASTPGGGATGADDDETGTTAAESPSSGGTAPGTATDSAAPATTTGDAPATDTTADGTGDQSATITDVSGEDDGTPGWVIPSGIVIVAAAIAFVLVQQRRRRAAEIDHTDD